MTLDDHRITPLVPMRSVALCLSLILVVLWTARPACAQQPEDSSRTPATSSESLTAYLPATVAGWERTSLDASTRGSEHLAVAQARYAKDDAQLQVVIRDLGGRPPRIEAGPGGGAAPESWSDYLAAARQQMEQGEAREVQYGDVLGFEGTGISDDVVVPHGVMALPGRRFQVAIFEVRDDLSSVADVKALSDGELNAMLDRARAVMQALDLEALAARAAYAK